MMIIILGPDTDVPGFKLLGYLLIVPQNCALSGLRN